MNIKFLICHRYIFLFLFFAYITQVIHAHDYYINNIDNLLFSDSITIEQEFSTRAATQQDQKEWTFIVYMAADNDLRSFAIRNIKQMAAIGSTANINIVVHLDIKITSKQKVTRRYYIEKEKLVQVNEKDPYTQVMDSGNPETLISCCRWAVKSYPAKKYVLVLWNHGTGCNDPIQGRIINPVKLFSFNPDINLLELDRSIGLFERLDDYSQRGICWDDSTGNYLTNQKLTQALTTIKNDVLHGNKFEIIGFDACLMSMLEVGWQIKDCAHIMVGSQEVEFGTGWDYAKILAPFTQQSLSEIDFAQHIVQMYGKVYSTITNDYTQSAINLDIIENLASNVNSVAQLLTTCLNNQVGNSVKKALWASHSKAFCTHFDEPQYIDLHHFYTNLLNNIRYFDLRDKQQETNLKNSLIALITQGQNIIGTIVIANTAGKNLAKAQGISIYFPEKRMHPSYNQTLFAQTNTWSNLLARYLLF